MGILAGLVPCPLTLFAMFLAVSKGVVAAGLTFAVAMMIGLPLTLIGVATVTVLARDRALALMGRHGASVERINRAFDLGTGMLLLAIGSFADRSRSA